MVFVYKKLAQFAVRCALPPRRSESPVCATVNKPSCALHLLGSFIGSRGFSSLARRPEFWVLQGIFIIYLAVLRLITACRTFSSHFGMWDLCGKWCLAPGPGIKHRPPALAVHRLSHWTSREVSVKYLEWYLAYKFVQC